MQIKTHFSYCVKCPRCGSCYDGVFCGRCGLGSLRRPLLCLLLLLVLSGCSLSDRCAKNAFFQSSADIQWCRQ